MNIQQINALVTAELLDDNFHATFVDEIYDWVRDAMNSDDEIKQAITSLIFNGEVTISWDAKANDLVITKLERNIH